MGTMNGIKKPTMTAKRARDVLQEILDKRKEISEKTVTQINALHIAAMILERANEEGANLIHEAGLVQYQANYITATLFCDEHTRNALKAAIDQIDKFIETRGGFGDE